MYDVSKGNDLLILSKIYNLLMMYLSAHNEEREVCEVAEVGREICAATESQQAVVLKFNARR